MFNTLLDHFVVLLAHGIKGFRIECSLGNYNPNGSDDVNRTTSGGGLVCGVNDFHKGKGLIRSIEGVFLPIDGPDEVLGRADPTHILVLFGYDGAVDRAAVLLHVELAIIDGGLIKTIRAKETADHATGLPPLEGDGHLFALVHLGPRGGRT